MHEIVLNFALLGTWRIHSWKTGSGCEELDKENNEKPVPCQTPRVLRPSTATRLGGLGQFLVGPKVLKGGQTDQ